MTNCDHTALALIQDYIIHIHLGKYFYLVLRKGDQDSFK